MVTEIVWAYVHKRPKTILKQCAKRLKGQGIKRRERTKTWIKLR